MNRAGWTLCFAMSGWMAADAQVGRKPLENAVYPASHVSARPNMGGAPLSWNPGHMVLFKGTVRGIQHSAPMADGKSWVSLLVKLKNGGTAFVELGPRDYVEAQSLRLRVKAPIWVAGSKTFTDSGDSVILAQRVNFDGHRPSFRRPDGRPFWER